MTNVNITTSRRDGGVELGQLSRGAFFEKEAFGNRKMQLYCIVDWDTGDQNSNEMLTIAHLATGQLSKMHESVEVWPCSKVDIKVVL